MWHVLQHLLATRRYLSAVTTIESQVDGAVQSRSPFSIYRPCVNQLHVCKEDKECLRAQMSDKCRRLDFQEENLQIHVYVRPSLQSLYCCVLFFHHYCSVATYTTYNNTSHSVTLPWLWKPARRRKLGPRLAVSVFGSSSSLSNFPGRASSACLDEQLSIPSHILAANTQYGSRQAG